MTTRYILRPPRIARDNRTNVSSCQRANMCILAKDLPDGNALYLRPEGRSFTASLINRWPICPASGGPVLAQSIRKRCDVAKRYDGPHRAGAKPRVPRHRSRCGRRAKRPSRTYPLSAASRSGICFRSSIINSRGRVCISAPVLGPGALQVIGEIRRIDQAGRQEGSSGM